ncbi:MAG: hypothetical protein ACPL4K_00380 [Candidatus Margulisiibacteriota bacterium]
MAPPQVAPVIPNLGLQTEATAGSSAVIFTATDRKIIQERAGEINRNRSFLEIFSQKPLTQKVENEESKAHENKNVKELEGRWKEHRRMLKHSPIYHPKEQVEISKETMEEPEPELSAVTIGLNDKIPSLEKVETNNSEFYKETVAIAKELKLNPAEIFDKFLVEQEGLHSLVSRIKELHLKRLLTNDPKEFEELTKTIRSETLASARPEAKEWVEQQLKKLTESAAEYKKKLLESLKAFQESYALAG